MHAVMPKLITDADAQLTSEQLRALGVEVHTGVAATRVVGVFCAGHSDCAIGLRADMDADRAVHDRHRASVHAGGT